MAESAKQFQPFSIEKTVLTGGVLWKVFMAGAEDGTAKQFRKEQRKTGQERGH